MTTKHLVKGLVAAAIIIPTFTACVPARKFEELESKADKCAEENKNLKARVQTLETENNELTAELDDIRTRITRLNGDTAVLGASLRQMKGQYDKINSLNDELLKKMELLRVGSEEANRKLSAELGNLQTELIRKEDELKRLEGELNAKKSSLDNLSAELQKREARVQELESLIAEKDAKAKALQEKVKAALLAFEGKGLEIEQKNGKIYVKMEAKLLFASGSTKVGSEGKKALVQLAKVVEAQTDIEIQVEGHTDTDKINGSGYPRDNWDLSVLRSTSVVNIMLDNSTIDPKTITAAGKGEFTPVDPDDKSKNRRIEIVLVPNLDALYEVLDNTK